MSETAKTCSHKWEVAYVERDVDEVPTSFNPWSGAIQFREIVVERNILWCDCGARKEEEWRDAEPASPCKCKGKCRC